MRARWGVLLAVVLALGGCRAAAYREYHHTRPVEYYFRYPSEALSGPPVLVVAIFGEGGSLLDCIDLFLPFAEDRGYALLCPELGGEAGPQDVARAEVDLAAVLTELYADYTFRDAFFLAGFGDGGTFALGYALRYPQAISGVSAMSVREFPGPVRGGGPPMQLIVGADDREAQQAVQEIEAAWRDVGQLIRIIEIEGDGRSPSQGFARLASELSDETARQR